MRGLGPILAALAACGVTGCMIPVVAPPLRTTAAASASAGRLESDEATAVDTRPLEQTTELRFAALPMQMIDREQEREWDVGVGYFLQIADDDSLVFRRHGPFLELGYHPWQRRTRHRNGTFRLGVHGGGEIVLRDVADDFEVGAGASLSATIEVVGYGRGAAAEGDSDGFFAFAAGGEYAMGLTANTSYRTVGDESWWTAGVGVSLRTPGVAGFAFVIPKRF